VACEILFESIVLKVDELDGSLRQFFERLKRHIESKGKDYQFTQREIRQKFNISKSQMQRYMYGLLSFGYVHQSGGHPNRGVKYRIDYWDNYAKLRADIKDDLMNQINEL